MQFLAALSYKKTIILLSLLGAFVSILLHSAIYEDAYITFRVVENLLQGDGLRWNLDERVQAYTNPLWLFLHVPLEAHMGDIYFVSLLLCWVCSLLAFYLSWCVHRSHVLLWALLFVAPFIFSRALAVYATSGFENPLLHVLFAVFMWAFYSKKGAHKWFLLSLFTALSMITRLDMAIFYGPIWLLLLTQKDALKHLKCLIYGGLPLALWCAFSLFYYGFLLPNTSYAKLYTDIPQAEYFRIGWHYALNLLTVDPYSALVIIVSVCMVPLLALRTAKKSRCESLLYYGIALAIACYSFYAVSVGGTYLSGRLFSLPIFAGLYLLCRLFIQAKETRKTKLVFFSLVFFGFVTTASWPAQHEIKRYCRACLDGINLPHKEEKNMFINWVRTGEKGPVPRSYRSRHKLRVAGSIGRWGYAMHPDTKIIDHIAISEPLLARLPTKSKRIYSTGNFSRQIPKGYLRAAETGDTSLMHRNLARYYEKLRFIISGPLFSTERLKTTLKFNLGHYDKYRRRYVKHQARRNARQAISRRQNPSGQSTKSTAR